MLSLNCHGGIWNDDDGFKLTQHKTMETNIFGGEKKMLLYVEGRSNTHKNKISSSFYIEWLF